MKFSCSVDIEGPLASVAELYFPDKDREHHLKQWQDGLQSLEHVEGEYKQIGAKSQYIYLIGNREMELLETITSKNWPHEIGGLYVAKAMENTMMNRFEAIDENNTRYTTEIHYTRFNGIIPKLMVWLNPGMFKKPVQKWLDQFKAFAEDSLT